MKPRDFHAPDERMVRNSAHVLPKGTVAPSVGVGGTDLDQLALEVGVAWTPVENFAVGTNVAHLGGGLVNADVQWRFLEAGDWAFGAQAGGIWMNVRWMWYLFEIDPDAKEALAHLNVVTVPVSALSTWDFADWGDATVGVTYLYSGLIGTVDTDVVVFGGQLGARRLAFEPTVRLYAGPVGFWVSASLPAGVWVTTNADTEVAAEEGVVAGARSHEWARLPFADTWKVSGGAQVRFGATYVDLGIASAPVVRALKMPVWPYLAAHWRL